MTEVTAAAFLCATIIAPSAFARWSFQLTAGDRKLSGGQVCFLRVDPTRSGDPAAQLFPNNDAHCMPADELLDIPKHAFVMYAVHPDGFVSSTLEMIVPATPTGVVSTPATGTEDTDPAVDCIKTIAVPMIRSGTVDLTSVMPSLTSGQHAVAYTSDTPETKSMAYPAVRGATSVTVPANRDLVVLILQDGRPVRVSAPLRVEVGASKAPRFEDTGATVVTWAAVDRPYLVANVARGSKFGPIRSVLAMPDGREIKALFPMLHGANIHGTLQIFRNVPEGTATVRALGSKWTSETVSVAVPRSGVVYAGPLRSLPAATIEVTYLLDTGAVAAGDQTRSCGEEERKHPDASLVLSRCVTAGTQQETALGSCGDLTRRLLEVMGGIASFDSVPFGRYKVALRYGEGEVASQEMDVHPNDELRTSVRGALFSVFGRVTHGGKGVRATLKFAMGSAVSDETGRYGAVLAATPGPELIDIEACDGSFHYTHIPSSPPSINTAYDINVPRNWLKFTVVDATTNAPIAKSRVHYAVARPDRSDAAFFTRSATTNEQGVATQSGLPADRDIVACARAEGYVQACSEIGKVKDEEEKNVLLALRREGERNGSIRSAEPLQLGEVFRLSAAGRVENQVAVRSDGTFSVGWKEAPGDYYVVVSSNLPLYVVPPAGYAVTNDGLVITLPTIPARSFSVKTSDAETYAIGIAIGGYPVPVQAFLDHQSRRQLPYVLIRGGPLRIPDVAESAAITVARGPVMRNYPRTLTPGFDVFTAPEYAATAIRKPVLGEQVLFEH